jgi:outer membrane receptor protein involved in Fe transport
LKFGGEFRVNLDNTPNYNFASFSFSNGLYAARCAECRCRLGQRLRLVPAGLSLWGQFGFQSEPGMGQSLLRVFVQDDWRVTRTLTLNFGGRWDYESRKRSASTAEYRLSMPTSPARFKFRAPLKGGLLFASRAIAWPISAI